MTSLYIHIPFCKKKCNYCDFVSYAGKEELIDEYVEALIREFESLCSVLAPSEVEGFRFQLSTIYFGGGTPTLLTSQHLRKIFEQVESRAQSTEHREISIEANPGTADRSKLKELKKLSINRISIGAQSFNDQHLKILGRIHNSDDIFRFYKDARSAGFDNINLDLIFALPNQTLDQWKKDLDTAIHLNPNHLSTYNLQVEEGTNLFEVIIKSQKTNNKQIPNSKYQLPNEEEELQMYEYAIETLIANGYRHYEISNFAKPGFECKHNINYWKNGNYIGIGAGAHSHIDGIRWANPESLEAYINNAPHKTQDATAQRDTLFLGLRLLEGLPVKSFKGFEKEAAELTENGLLTRENDHYKLTRQGLYLANEVFAEFV